jgi:hypothetical protein
MLELQLHRTHAWKCEYLVRERHDAQRNTPRRTGVTTFIVKEITPKGVFHMLDHILIIVGMTLALNSHQKLEDHSQHLEKIEKFSVFRIISIPSENPTWLLKPCPVFG